MGKILDGIGSGESVLYRAVRNKFDEEIAKANGTDHSALEHLADLVCDEIKSRTDACQQILASKKAITGAYSAMSDKARKEHIYVMTDRQGLEIALEYFDIHIADGTAATEQPSEKSEAPAEKPSASVSLFDLL